MWAERLELDLRPGRNDIEMAWKRGFVEISTHLQSVIVTEVLHVNQNPHS